MDAKTKVAEVLYAELFKDFDSLAGHVEALKTEIPQIFHAEKRQLEHLFIHQLACLEKFQKEMLANSEEHIGIFRQQRADIKNLSDEQIRIVQQQIGYLVNAAEKLDQKKTEALAAIEKLIAERGRTIEATIKNAAENAVETALKNRIAALKTATDEHREETLKVKQAAHIVFYLQLGGYLGASIIGSMITVALLRFFP